MMLYEWQYGSVSQEKALFHIRIGVVSMPPIAIESY